MRHLPNIICLVRIALIVPLLQAMVAGEQALILVLFSIAAVSDALDGYLAKRFQWTSDLGRILDPMADKLLLMSVFITAAWLDIAPWWVATVAVARDLVIGFAPIQTEEFVQQEIQPVLEKYADLIGLESELKV